MSIDERKELCLNACTEIEQVANFIKQELGKVGNELVEEKSFNSLVSYVDKTAEEMLVKQLGRLLPEASFLTEEETVVSEKKAYQWIIDPLDGTTNFLFQLPHFCISVALQHNDETIIGIVHEVNHNECFYAWKGGGAYLNKQPILVSKRSTLSEALIATGFPYYDYERVDRYLELLKYFMLHTRGIRRFGAAALDLAYVACGRFDAYYEYSLHPWDVAAGALLVTEAGGKVYDFNGGDNYIFGKEIISVNSALEEEMVRHIKQAFYPDNS